MKVLKHEEIGMSFEQKEGGYSSKPYRKVYSSEMVADTLISIVQPSSYDQSSKVVPRIGVVKIPTSEKERSIKMKSLVREIISEESQRIECARTITSAFHRSLFGIVGGQYSKLFILHSHSNK